MKARYELECECKICGMRFVIWKNWIPSLKEIGSGTHIGKFVCPNCQRTDLDLDICVREIPKTSVDFDLYRSQESIMSKLENGKSQKNRGSVKRSLGIQKNESLEDFDKDMDALTKLSMKDMWDNPYDNRWDKVWVVEHTIPYEGIYSYDIFDSKEKAKEFTWGLI